MIGSSIMVLMILYCPVFSEAGSGPYQLVSEISSNAMANGQSTGIFVDRHFNIYVTQPSQHRVDVFNQSGINIRSISLGPTGQPVDVAVRLDGTPYVVDMLNGRVKIVGVPPKVYPFQLDMPCGLDFDGVDLVIRERTRVLKLLFHTNYTSSLPITPVDAQTNGIEPCPIEAANQSIYYTRNHRINSTTLSFNPELPPNDSSVSDIATDPLGNVFVMTLPWEIKKLNSNGKYITRFDFEDEFFKNHTGTFWNSKIATDSEDTVYVLDSTNGKVLKFKQGGRGQAQFQDPWEIAVDSLGNVYVADSGNFRVQKFTTTGDFINRWGHSGDGNGQFNRPGGVAVDSSGNVFVTDDFNHRIQKFTNNGFFITKWGSNGEGDGQFNRPTSVAVDSSGNVYVADMVNHRIQKFTNTGTFITKWGSNGEGDGQFNFPEDVAVDSSGNVFVADTFNHRIQKFTNTGTFITKWGSNGTGDGQFNRPFGVAVDSSGNVYVADTDNNRIQKFTSNGQFITKWGTHGVGDGQLIEPVHVAVDPEGNLFVTDDFLNRIQKFTNTGNFITKWGFRGKW
jgi:DNA-binding beta-propeller fold protein YncE